MESDITDQLRRTVEEIIRSTADVVRREVERMRIETKDDGSPVTNVDLAVESHLRSCLEKAFPDHGIFGEEYDPRNPDAEWVWLIDPIDGTRQFAAGLPNYGILLSLCEGSVPRLGVVCQPILGDVYLGIGGSGAWRNGSPIQTAQIENPGDAIVGFSDPDAYDAATIPGFERLRKQSRWNVYDGGCLSFAALASGHIGVSVYAPNLDDYDFCALVPLVEGAGGVVSDWYGRKLTRESRGAIVASCTDVLHDKVLSLLT